MTSEQYAKSINTLSRAPLISTNNPKGGVEYEEGVNALNRAPLISTVEKNVVTYDGTVCQCPKPSNNHFYITVNSVLRPKKQCVNALSRAITISTVHSGNPLFTRLSRYVFASNSQNILKINFFSLFFGSLNFTYIFRLLFFLDNYIIHRSSKGTTSIV